MELEEDKKEKLKLPCQDHLLSLKYNKKAKKPMIEKKRRDRMNRCLEGIKRLVLQAKQQPEMNYRKMEKADILEMTETFLQSIVYHPDFEKIFPNQTFLPVENSRRIQHSPITSTFQEAQGNLINYKLVEKKQKEKPITKFSISSTNTSPNNIFTKVDIQENDNNEGKYNNKNDETNFKKNFYPTSYISYQNAKYMDSFKNGNVINAKIKNKYYDKNEIVNNILIIKKNYKKKTRTGRLEKLSGSGERFFRPWAIP